MQRDSRAPMSTPTSRAVVATTTRRRPVNRSPSTGAGPPTHPRGVPRGVIGEGQCMPTVSRPVNNRRIGRLLSRLWPTGSRRHPRPLRTSVSFIPLLAGDAGTWREPFRWAERMSRMRRMPNRLWPRSSQLRPTDVPWCPPPLPPPRLPLTQAMDLRGTILVEQGGPGRHGGRRPGTHPGSTAPPRPAGGGTMGEGWRLPCCVGRNSHFAEMSETPSPWSVVCLSKHTLGHISQHGVGTLRHFERQPRRLNSSVAWSEGDGSS